MHRFCAISFSVMFFGLNKETPPPPPQNPKQNHTHTHTRTHMRTHTHTHTHRNHHQLLQKVTQEGKEEGNISILAFSENIGYSWIKLVLPHGTIYFLECSESTSEHVCTSLLRMSFSDMFSKSLEVEPSKDEVDKTMKSASESFKQKIFLKEPKFKDRVYCE